jgi:hypothetical protein
LETGLQDILVDNYLITKWAFGNTLILVEEIIGKLGMSDKGVPMAKEMQDWVVPDALMFGLGLGFGSILTWVTGLMCVVQISSNIIYE